MTELAAPEEKLVVDRYSLLPLWVGVLIAHGVALFFYVFLTDNPGVGVALIGLGLPVVLIVVAWWVAMILRASIDGRRRLAASRFGVFIGLALVIAMAFLGAPPWRVWFELARPFYFTRVWLEPARAEPILLFKHDTELWSNFQTTRIIYDSNETRRRSLLEAPAEQNPWGTGFWRDDLGFGFYREIEIN